MLLHYSKHCITASNRIFRLFCSLLKAPSITKIIFLTSLHQKERYQTTVSASNSSPHRRNTSGIGGLTTSVTYHRFSEPSQQHALKPCIDPCQTATSERLTMPSLTPNWHIPKEACDEYFLGNSVGNTIDASVPKPDRRERNHSTIQMMTTPSNGRPISFPACYLQRNRG